MIARTHKERDDRETVPEYLARIGRTGGTSTSADKRAASKANLEKARAKRWPKKNAHGKRKGKR